MFKKERGSFIWGGGGRPQTHFLSIGVLFDRLRKWGKL